MNAIFRHRDFRSIEDRWLIRRPSVPNEENNHPISTNLIHIVPDEDGIGTGLPSPTSNVVSKLEKLMPPCPALGIEEVDPSRTSSPAPSFEIFTVGLLDEQFLIFSFLENGVVRSSLEMRVDDDDHLDN